MKDDVKTRVLVAEDDFVISEEIVRITREAGFDLIGVASNGREAVTLAGSLRPDVVLMDIEMPVMDGLEATVQIQKSCPAPVVILTAHRSEDFLHRATDVGVGAYLTKPPEVATMKHAIAIAQARFKDLMELRRLNRELASRNQELQRALDELETLRGIIPICTHCKRVHPDEKSWEQLHVYVTRHSQAKFSHGICPRCSQELERQARARSRQLLKH